MDSIDLEMYYSGPCIIRCVNVKNGLLDILTSDAAYKTKPPCSCCLYCKQAMSATERMTSKNMKAQVVMDVVTFHSVLVDSDILRAEPIHSVAMKVSVRSFSWILWLMQTQNKRVHLTVYKSLTPHFTKGPDDH